MEPFDLTPTEEERTAQQERWEREQAEYEALKKKWTVPKLPKGAKAPDLWDLFDDVEDISQGSRKEFAERDEFIVHRGWYEYEGDGEDKPTPRMVTFWASPSTGKLRADIRCESNSEEVNDWTVSYLVRPICLD